jgi:predicted nucleic acid-binding protein
MLVVADTSALLALAACNGLQFLDALFREVRVPRAVYRECTVPGKPGALCLAEYLAGKIDDIRLSDFVIAAAGLGQGELEAMALYKRLQADRLLIDDSRARKVAMINGAVVIGSVGVLILAKDEGLLPTIRPALEAIRQSGIYLGETLIAEALSIAGEASSKS